jgi:hypothetical protein
LLGGPHSVRCGRRCAHRDRPQRFFRRLALELLEDRTLPSGAQTLATALALTLQHNQATASGSLAVADEADLYRVSLKAGDVVTAAVQAEQGGSTLDSVLRVFDPNGRPFALSDNYDGQDPRLTFQAATSGTYYLGISGAGNTRYDPRVPGSGAGRSAGLYTVSLTRLQAATAAAPDVVGASFQVSQAAALWGDRLTVTYTIENRGGAVANNFDTVLALTTDNGLSTNVIPLGTIHLDRLAADATVSGTLTITLPGAPGRPPPGFAEPETVYLGLLVPAGLATGGHPGNNGLRQGMNEAALNILQAQAPAVPNGPAAPLGLGAQVTGQLGPHQTALYQLDFAQAGRLIARAQAGGTAVRLLLYDSQHRLLVQSDGQSPADRTDVIDQHLDPADTAAVYYLAVSEVAGGSGSYTLSTGFEPALAPVQPLPVGGDPYFLVWADFNGDGIPDLAVPDNSSSAVRVFLGNGDGSFQPYRSMSVTNSPTSVVVGDFNGDGRPDLAVLCQGTKDNVGDAIVLLGNGDGTFTASQPISLGSYPETFVAGDFNGDGRLDLVATDDDDNDLRVLLGNGNGTFTAGQKLDVGQTPFAITAGDFNGDGILDVAVANSSDGTVETLLGNGDGTFTALQTLTVGVEPQALAVADLTGDGRFDLAVADGGSRAGAAPGDVTVLVGNGDGTFHIGQRVTVGTYPFSVVPADLTGDGQLDLVVADLYSDDVRVLVGNGHGSFQALPPIAVGNEPLAVTAADFNGDGRIDLAAADENSDDVTVVLNDGNLSFRAPPILAVGSDPWFLLARDFNGDGRLDLASANLFSNNVQMLSGNGDGTFQIAQSEAVGAYPYTVASGDFNGDGRLDLAVADANSTDVRVLLGNGDGTFRVVQTITVGNYPTGLVAGDFNGDGILDLAVADETSNDLRVFLGNGNGSFRLGQKIDVGTYPLALVAGDFNGDGHLDLAVAENGSDDVKVLLNQGDGTFQVTQSVDVGTYPVSLTVGDVNGDGVSDLVVGDRGVEPDASNGFVADSDVEILLGQGDGTFQVTQTIPQGTHVSWVALGDFTGTGRLDLVATDQPSGTAYIYLNDGHGTFALNQTIPVGQGAVSTAMGDFNGDGRLDIVVADAWAGTLSMLLGNGDGTFSPLPVGQGLGQAPARPALTDVNGDGTLDLITRSQSGTVLYRQGIPGSPGTFQSPVVVNSDGPARDLGVLRTPRGTWIALLNVDGTAVTLFALQADGSFAPAQTLAVPGGNGARLAVAAVSSSAVDLVVTTTLSNQVLVYAQQSDGTYTGPLHSLPADLDPAAVQLADVNGDTLPDLVVANQASGDLTVFLNDAQQSFATVERLPAGSGPYGLAVSGASAVQSLEGTRAVLAGQFNEADATDLLALSSSGQTVTLLRGTGVTGGFFAPQVVLNLDFPATDMVAGDFNGDHHLDLAFLDTAHSQVVVYRGDGTGTFTRCFRTSAGSAPSGLTLADVNGDGLPDLLVGSRTGDVLILLGQRNATFQASFQHVERNLALATFTAQDGSLRFVSADEANNRVVVQDAHGNTSFVADASSGLSAPSAVAVADLNHDGLPDLLVANSGSNQLLVFLGTGDGQFSTMPLAFGVGSTPAGITVADLDRDRIPDVIVANEGSNTLSLLFGQGTGSGWTLVNGPELQTGAGPVATVVADVTGPHGKPDGIPDIVVSESQANDVRVLPGLGFGSFADARPIVVATGAGPGPLFLGHFTGAGLDLVTVNLLSNTLNVFANFARHVSPAARPSQTLSSGGQGPVAAAVGDFNGDGYADLIVANRDGTIAVFEGQPDGMALFEKLTVTLADVTSLAFGSHGTIIVGGLSGVVSVALQPVLSMEGTGFGPAIVPVATSIGSSTVATTTSSTLAVAAFVPAAGQTSGTAVLSESAGTTGAGSAAAGFDALGGQANQAAVGWMDTSPLAVQQGSALGDNVAASLLTGAKPTTRLLPQRKGGAAGAVATLSREEDGAPADSTPADDPDQPLTRVVGINYRNVRAPLPKPPTPPNGKPPSAVQGRLPAPTPGPEDDPLLAAPDRDDRVAEGLALALATAGVAGVWWRSRPVVP